MQSECTICGQMKRRKPVLAAFAKGYDLVLFVSGKNSANGKMLYEYCRSVNPITHWISGVKDIDPGWFAEVDSIGISGATSTSINQLQEVKEEVMFRAVRHKFRDPVLRRLLLETGDRVLREASPQDEYWGIGPHGTGANRLGVLLMRLRDELRVGGWPARV